MTTLALQSTNYYTNEIVNEFEFSEELLKEYEKQLQCTDATKQTYMQGINYFFNWLKKENINYVGENTLYDYKQHLIRHYDEEKRDYVMYSNSTINTLVVSLKRFYKFLERKGIYNTAKELKGTKTSRTHKRGALTIQQVRAIYDAVDINTLEGKRANAIIHLLITSGLRECEVVRANICDMQNNGNARVLKVQGKGRDEKDEFVILTASTQKAINEYLNARGVNNTSEPLFTSISDRNNGARLQTRTIRNIVKSLYHQVGIYDENITTHSTRHTAITLAIESGKTLPEVQALARHTNINTTMIYQHAYDKVNSNCESAIEKLIESAC